MTFFAPAISGLRWVRSTSPILIAVAMSLWSTQALAQRSEYSSLKNCPAYPSLRLPDQEVSSDAVRCKAPNGYSLFIVEEDPRSYVVLQRGKVLLNTYSNSFELGSFPNIGDSPAEWRMDAKGRPYAFIVRVLFQDADKPQQNRSRLLVYALLPTMRFIGAFASNEDARDAADKVKPAS